MIKEKILKKIIKVCIFIIFILFTFNIDSDALEMSTVKIIEDEIKKIDTYEYENELLKYIDNNKNFNIKENIKKVALADYEFSIKEIFINLIIYLKSLILKSAPLAVKIIVLALMSGFIKVLAESFKNKDINDIVYLVIYISIICLVYLNFVQINNLIEKIIDITLKLIKLAIPILTTLLVASGKFKTAAFFEPITFSFLNIMNIILIKIYLPLILILLNLIVINNISKKDIIKELINLLKKFIESTLKFLITFIFGLSIINKVSTSLFDGTIKTILVKGVGNLIPIVGKGIENTVDIILNCANLLKNSSGIVIIISYLWAIAKPLITLLAFIIIYKITIIIIEPIAENRIKELIKDIGDIITFSFTSVIMIIVIFVINMTMIFS